MGLFGNKKTETISFLEKLKELGIDFYSFKHEDLEPVDLSIDDEVGGIIKTSNKMLEDNSLFNFVSLSDRSDGNRELCLSKAHASEYDIKNIVDSFFNSLGPDYFLKEKFDQEDLDNIRASVGQGLRRWDDKSGYHILLGYNTSDKIINLYILWD